MYVCTYYVLSERFYARYKYSFLPAPVRIARANSEGFISGGGSVDDLFYTRPLGIWKMWILLNSFRRDLTA